MIAALKRAISIILVTAILIAGIPVNVFAEETDIIAVTEVNINTSALTLTVGGPAGVLTAEVLPDNATDKTITWSSSNDAVATVVEGMVTPLSAGITTITASAGGKTAECTVTVEAGTVAVTSIALDASELNLIVGGDTATLKATILPEDATDRTVTWTSSDDTVATVSEGVVKPLSTGSVTITAKAGEMTATCAVTVTASTTVAAESVTLSDRELTLTAGGETAALTAAVLPENATDKTVTWESSNSAVATVENGVVKPVAMGKATITAKATSGECTDSCEVTVWGSCGDDARWFVDGTTLIIEGSGAISDSASAVKQPWKDYRTKITAVELGSEITSIGKFSFAMFSKLVTLTIPEDSRLETIETSAFLSTAKLTSVTLPGTISTINDTNIASKEIHFRGTADQWETLEYPASKDVYVLDEEGNEVKYVADPYNGKCGAGATWNFDPETGKLTISGSGEMKEYTAAKYAPWYQHKDSIKTVEIQNGITSISGYAFAEYSNLETVSIPETVSKIGTYAFRTDTKLTSIDLTNVAYFGDYAFTGCEGLTSLTLEKANTIGTQAFINCSGLTTVTLGSSEHRVEKIGQRAFCKCTNLKDVSFVNVKEVGDYSFAESGLISADLSSVEIIGQYAFDRATSLSSVTLGEELAEICQSAFYKTGLTAVVIPGSVTAIGNYAFSYCTNMTEATLENGIGEIPEGCFSNNSKLSMVVLPTSLTAVGEYAFNGCTGLETVRYAGTKEQWNSVAVAANNDPLTNLMGEHSIAVTGVSLNQNTLNLRLGGSTETLIATVSPANATFSGVTWKSSDERVVTVDADGKLTPTGVGTAMVTVTTNDGNLTDTCEIVVEGQSDAVDISGFRFTINNPSITNANDLFEKNVLSVEKQADGSYKLIAPTYAIEQSANAGISMTIEAPSDFNTPFSVTYTAWTNDALATCLGETVAQSENGVVTINQFYNPRGKLASGLVDNKHDLEYSDFLISIDGSDQASRLEFSFYNELRTIRITNTSHPEVKAPSISQADDGSYEVVLTRGDTYSLNIAGGIQLVSQYAQSISYITEVGKEEQYEGTIQYTPGEEDEKDFVILISNPEPQYGISDATYSLHVRVEDPPEDRLSFEKFTYTLNGQEFDAVYKSASYGYVIPEITQYDEFSIKAVVTNADDTAEYEWTRGLGGNSEILDGETKAEVTISTDSSRAFDYHYRCSVTCRGQTITLPNLRVQKVVALKLAEPELLTQPVGGEYPVGTAAPLVAQIKSPEHGVLKCQWYRCDDQNGTNAEAIEGANTCTVVSEGRETTYTPPSTSVGTNWYYCEIYVYFASQDMSSPKVKTDCVKVEITESDLPLAGKGTEDNPYLITSAEDLEAIRANVENGNAFNGIIFAFANDVTLPDNWKPIGCTKDGSNDIKGGANLNAFSGTIGGSGKTLTVPAGGLPLLGYVNGATVKNLNIYGTQIAGYGLVNNFEGVDLEGTAIVIDNVTIKSGTKTLKAGLIGANITTNGFAGCSAGYVAIIRNCTVEEGVLIGYTGTESHIGSIAGRLQGTIENCVSYATVKGVNYVGGLVGSKDNAMGSVVITRSAFHGTVEGKSNVGGIAGGPYGGPAAPNAVRLTITACNVDGAVKGQTYVGGIMGGDTGVAQAWDGYSFVGNTFTGTVSGEQYVGGIIGYYQSLNKFDNIASNTYSAECGAEKGIGFVKYLDTSYANPTKMDGTIVINTGNGVAGCPTVTGCAWRANHNRTDDPLGKDADKLCQKIGGTTKPICYELKVSGTYKTEYTVGDALDLTGIKLTGSWTDGKTSDVALKDVTIEGYDKDKTGDQTISLSYGAAKAYITVTVKPKSTKITVSVSVLGHGHHSDPTSNGGPHGLARGGLTSWYSGTIEADTAETVWDVLQRTGMAFTADANNSYGSIYIRAVNGLAEFDNGPNSGWMYTVNGSHPEVGVSARYVKSGDKIVLHYTDDYTYEEGGVNYGKDVLNADAVDKLISEIGTVTATDACKKKIDAARSAYNALSAAEKAKVTKLATLEAAEKKYDQLKAQEVVALINKIGTVTINSGTAINNAWNAYNALTAAQQKLVTNLATLQKATQQWNQLKADEVIELIDKIDDPVTEQSEQAIKDARAAYDKLTVNQRKLVTNYKKLTDAETAIAKLVATEEDKKKAQEVIDMIDKLGDVTLDSEKDVAAARKAYDALTDLQKKLVENYDVLEAAETKLVLLKALGKVTDPYITTGDYIQNLGTPSVGAVGGEWMVIGLARSDREIPNVEDYYKSVVQYVRENIDENERLHQAKSTDNSRLIIALTAIGKDVTDVDGHNLLVGLNDLDFVKKQGNNGPIWALIALDSGNYPVPEGNVTRQALIDEILSVQTSDGGWAISGDEADSDMTGMALQALAPYYKKDLQVQLAVDKAIARLSEMQNKDGGFSTFSGNGKVATSESISQVVVAITALGIDPNTDERFVKNGNSAIDALLKYYVNGGGFKHILNGQRDGMGTEQAYYALTAYYRFLMDKTSLYDMTDVIDMGGDLEEEIIQTETTEATEPTEIAEVEESNGGFPWWVVIVVLCAGGACAAVVILLPKFKKGKFM